MAGWYASRAALAQWVRGIFTSLMNARTDLHILVNATTHSFEA